MAIRSTFTYDLDKIFIGNKSILDIISSVCHAQYDQRMVHWGLIKGKYEAYRFFLIGINFNKRWNPIKKEREDLVELCMRNYYLNKGYNIPNPPLPNKFLPYHHNHIQSQDWSHLD